MTARSTANGVNVYWNGKKWVKEKHKWVCWIPTSMCKWLFGDCNKCPFSKV